MDLKEIKAVIDLMTKNGLSEFEMEKPEFKIRIRRGSNGEFNTVAANPGSATLPVAQTATTPAPLTVSTGGSAASATNGGKDPSLKQILSPMVGTFYRSPSPDSPSYIEVGQEVNEETVVCIIEAMKVMNEIKAEMKGVIVEVLAQNNKPVEFGKPLFALRPL